MFTTKIVSLFRITSVLAAAAFELCASAATVPFTGSLEGHYTSVPGENPTTLVASGNASHLGRFSYSFLAEVSPDASTASGTVTFVAANGDKIYGDFTGETTSVDLPFIWLEEEVTVAGGTGRFENVTG